MTGQTMRRLRRYHLYSGMLFAPAILFFAFSGLIQVTGWHDEDSAPRWVKAMANIHTHQWTTRPPRPGQAERPRPGPDPAMAHEDEHEHEHHHDAGATPFIPLKPFALLTAFALLMSAVLGIVIALTTPATRRMSLVMLAIGLVLPVALLLA